MDQYYIEAYVNEISRMARQIHAGHQARAAVAVPAASAVAPLEAATMTKKPGMHENPFNAAQATRVG